MRVPTKWVVTAILVVLIICVMVYAAQRQPGWAHLDYWKAHYVEDPDQIYERTAGGYDEAAELALRRSEDHPDPSPADHLRAATIIHRNVISQEHRPRITPDGLPTAADQEVARIRRDMFGRARDHYMHALVALTNQQVARDEAARAVRRFGLPGADPDAGPARAELPGRPGAEFIIDAALDFAFRGLDTLLDNDPLVTIFFPEGMFERGGAPPDAEMVDLATDRRLQTIQTRRAAAAEVAEAEGGGRGAQADAFLDLSQRNTSDSQNVHDPSVNAAKRAIVELLREDQGAYQRLPTLDQIVDEINAGSDTYSRDPRTSLPRPALTEKAIAVVRRAHNGDRSASAGATDEEVLRRVWGRADDPENSSQHALMRQAAYDALVDSWERGIGGDKIQCVDGRIGRMLGSLTLLDHDERCWEMRRLEQHKNDIYALAAEVIRAAAVEAAESTDYALQQVGKSYLATTPAELREVGDVDEARERSWTAATRQRVSQAIDEHIAEVDARVPGVIPKHAVEGIKAEALAALD